jgi:hypothetical protein
MMNIRIGKHCFGALAAVALAVSLILGCANPLSPVKPVKPSPVSEGTGRVLVQIAGQGAAARTLLPGVPELYYALEFEQAYGQPYGPVRAIMSNGTAKEITLPATDGTWTWNLSVLGYLTQADAEAGWPAIPMVVGDANSIAVAAGATTPITVDMVFQAFHGQTGTLNYSITFPNVPPVTAAELAVTRLEGDYGSGGDAVAPINLLSNNTFNTITGTGGSDSTAVGSIELDTGYYVLSIRLDNGKFVRYSDIAVVLENQETPAVFTFTAGSFAEARPVTQLTLGQPERPVKGAAPQSTWNDNAVMQYTGTIAWQNADGTPFSGNFGFSTVYKAIVTLTAKNG